MPNLIIFISLNLVALVLFFSVYFKHPQKFIKYHKYSLYVDILAIIFGIYLVFVGFLVYDEVPQHQFHIWIQFLVGISIFAIHLARLVVREFTKKKFD